MFYEEETRSSEPLSLNSRGQSLLNSAARWAKFIAIVNFITCGIMAILALTAKFWFSSVYGNALAVSGMAGMGSTILSVSYLIGAAVGIVVALYLYRFAVKTRQALNQQDNRLLTESIGELNTYFRINGIILILFLAFLALAFVGGFMAAIAAGIAA